MLLAPDPTCPLLTLTWTAWRCSASRADELLRSTLGEDSKRRLGPMLASRGFDMTRTIHVVVLASGEGIVLTQ
jgi:hypothetical protein